MAVLHDLRDFLNVLEKNSQLLKISEEVQLEPDIGAAGRAITKLGETSPALYFDNVKGYNNVRIVGNTHGSWRNHALMMGMPRDTVARDQFTEFVKRYEKFPVKRVQADMPPPWKENVIEKDINLFEILPLFRINTGDGGYYLDKSSIVTRDPDDPNAENVGMYRLEVKRPNQLGIQMVPEHDIAVHFKHAEERNENLPIYICLGCSPLMEIVASMPILYTQCEYDMVGALQGEPCRVVKMETGHEVPWGAEFILEGHVKPRYREAEGPFGEFTGHYSGMKAMPIVEITKVYHRNDPIFEACFLGMPWSEIDYMMAINTGAPLYVQLRESFPEVKAVNAMYSHGLVVIISTALRNGGFARHVAMRCLTTPHGMGYAKVVIVVDDDVDPFDLKQVMWALSTKFNPEFDAINIPRLSILPLDPASSPTGMSTKMILDATQKIPPDVRGGEIAVQLSDPPKTAEWEKKLAAMIGKGA